jgi:transposase
MRLWSIKLTVPSQEKLPLYLGFFEFVHNARRRGKALIAALVG